MASQPEIKLKSKEFDPIYETPPGSAVPRYKTFLAGDWHTGEAWSDVRSPIDLSVVAEVPVLSEAAAVAAFESVYASGRSALREMPGTKRLDVYHRTADLIEAAAEDFATVLTVNAGKTGTGAMGEVKASVERLRKSDLDTRKLIGDYIPGDWSAETVETEGLVRREPIGVVLAINPFNYPLFDAVNKLVYSTIAGNAIVIKPASSTPLASLLLARMLEVAGFPRKSLAVLTMKGSQIGRIAGDERVAGITLTGSTQSGREILKLAGIKRYVLELGGGDPAIVLDDADLPVAAQKIVGGMTSFAGQRCDAIKHVFVEEVVYDEVKRLIVAELAKIKVGDPRAPGVSMGPLLDRASAVTMQEAIQDAVAKGARVLAGATSFETNYVEPTLLEISGEALATTELYKGEVFAPVATITPFTELRRAIEMANGRRYGLDAAVFGRDMNRIRRMIRTLEVGAIYINDQPRHGIGYYPYGGRKDSGIGESGIGYTISYVTAPKSIVYNYKGAKIWEYL
ncbi:MAG: aldehyde dehydrogenase family protein [Nitrososphaerales archaeon]|jgi:glyceraldehyde-3-phosphate dehydrogenase [NAD(P)+]